MATRFGRPAAPLLALAAIATALLAFASMAAAQPGARAEWVDLERVGSVSVRVRTRWTAADESGAQRGMVDVLGSAGESALAFLGAAPVVTTTAADGRHAVVGAYVPEPGGALSLTMHRVVGGRVERAGELAMPGHPAADRSVSGLVITATPTGFAVLLQEQSDADVASGGVHSFFATYDPEGRPLTPPTQVGVDWGVSAMVWDGRGYTLLVLFYGFGDERMRGLTRVCAVTLTPQGQPEQHPWWVSPFEAVGRVRAISAPGEGGVAVYWEGGAGGEELRSQVIEGARTWGVEPPAPRRHGRRGAAFALELDDARRSRLLRE